VLEEASGGDEVFLQEALENLRATTENPHFLPSWAAGKAASLVETSLSLRAGDSLGPYRIERRLASGGLGEVYEPTDLRLRRKVAIKVLAAAASDAATRTRILEEARIISRLNHPLICGVYDVGIDDGVPYLVMQLLEGATLRETLQQKLPPPAIALGWSIDIAEALHHAHSAGVVHRDLKPENIVITRTGATLIDFGISALIAVESADSQDAGTLPYMSPEQLQGEPATPLSDLFSFGAILFELLHGRPAFAAPILAIANSISPMSGHPPSPP
jgi:serine/threonine protein kinase